MTPNESIRTALRNSLLLALDEIDRPEFDIRTIASRVRQQAALAVIQLDEQRELPSMEAILKGK